MVFSVSLRPRIIASLWKGTPGPEDFVHGAVVELLEGDGGILPRMSVVLDDPPSGMDLGPLCHVVVHAGDEDLFPPHHCFFFQTIFHFTSSRTRLFVRLIGIIVL